MLRDILFYLKRVSKFFRESLRFLVILIRDRSQKRGIDADLRIAYNGYSSGPKKDWFYTFVQAYTGQQLAVSWYKPSLIITSAFGSYWLLKLLLLIYKVPSIFFSEENLATLKKYREYTSYLNGQSSLAMGFDYRFEENYRRFPLWLLYIFTPEFAASCSIEDIQQRLDQIERQSLNPKSKFAAMVASHDGYASEKKVYGCLSITSRAFITTQIAAIDFVHCPGKLLHNDDSLKREYNDDKKSYLKQFLFNICAENASVEGYVTEKLFEAVEAGTIPVYWGAHKPEPRILNQHRIIFWDENQMEEVLETVESLHRDSRAREHFLQQPIFTEHASQEIYGYFRQLRSDYDNLLRK